MNSALCVPSSCCTTLGSRCVVSMSWRFWSSGEGRVERGSCQLSLELDARFDRERAARAVEAAHQARDIGAAAAAHMRVLHEPAQRIDAAP